MPLHRAGMALLSIALSAGLPIDLAGLRRLAKKSGANTGDSRWTKESSATAPDMFPMQS